MRASGSFPPIADVPRATHGVSVDARIQEGGSQASEPPFTCVSLAIAPVAKCLATRANPLAVRGRHRRLDMRLSHATMMSNLVATMVPDRLVMPCCGCGGGRGRRLFVD